MGVFWQKSRHLQREKANTNQVAVEGGLDNKTKKLILNEIQAWHNSAKLRDMQIGEDYYNVMNDIVYSQRQVVGKNGQLCSIDNIADSKLSHAFLRELVDQKTQYLLGKDWSVSGDGEYFERVCDFFDRKFSRTLISVTRDAIIHGLSWIHVYYNERGELNFLHVDPKDIIPIWADGAHTRLEGLIRFIAQNDNKHQVEYWHQNGIFTFELIGSRLVEKRTGKNESGKEDIAHFMHNGRPYVWDRIPFIPIKYNDQELPLISFVKTLIDDYDLTASNLSNALQDQPNSILVIKNYDGQKLDEFRHNLSVYRAVKVSDDGGVEAINTPVCHEAATTHLEQLRRDIYAFGRGVDTRNEHAITAAGSIALKHVYARLDLDCNGIESFLQGALDEILFFIDAHLRNTKKIQCKPTKIAFVFNRDIIISEESAIDMCVKSKNIISDQTIVANHPWVSDVSEEKIRIAAELKNNKGIANG